MRRLLIALCFVALVCVTNVQAERAFSKGHRVMSFAELSSSVWQSERDCPSLCDASCEAVNAAHVLSAKNCGSCLLQGVPCGTHLSVAPEASEARFRQRAPGAAAAPAAAGAQPAAAQPAEAQATATQPAVAQPAAAQATASQPAAVQPAVAQPAEAQATGATAGAQPAPPATQPTAAQPAQATAAQPPVAPTQTSQISATADAEKKKEEEQLEKEVASKLAADKAKAQPTAEPAPTSPPGAPTPLGATKPPQESSLDTVQLALTSALQIKKVLALQKELLEELQEQREAAQEQQMPQMQMPYGVYPQAVQQPFMPMQAPMYMLAPQQLPYRPYRRTRFTHRLHDALGTDAAFERNGAANGDAVARLSSNLEELLEYVKGRKAEDPTCCSHDEVVGQAQAVVVKNSAGPGVVPMPPAQQAALSPDAKKVTPKEDKDAFVVPSLLG